jgi:hypothetical protein
VALDAGAAERHHGLRHVERNEGALRRLGGFDMGDRRKISLAGSSAKVLSSNWPSVAGIDIADHGDPQRVLASTRLT